MIAAEQTINASAAPRTHWSSRRRRRPAVATAGERIGRDGPSASPSKYFSAFLSQTHAGDEVCRGEHVVQLLSRVGACAASWRRPRTVARSAGIGRRSDAPRAWWNSLVAPSRSRDNSGDDARRADANNGSDLFDVLYSMRHPIRGWRRVAWPCRPVPSVCGIVRGAANVGWAERCRRLRQVLETGAMLDLCCRCGSSGRDRRRLRALCRLRGPCGSGCAVVVGPLPHTGL